jgi:hypothetical protein
MNDAKSQTGDLPPSATHAADNPQAAKSRFEKFASTQAGGDGIEGDPLKQGKTIDEKLGANMPDRK